MPDNKQVMNQNNVFVINSMLIPGKFSKWDIFLCCILMNFMGSGRTAPGSQCSVGLFRHGARHGRHRGRLRLQALILQTLVAIVFPVVHRGTVEGPFFMCFIRHNVRRLPYIS